MNQRRQLLGLLDSLKQLSRVEHQAVAEGEFSRLEQVQDEKKLIRQQIEELEPIPEGEMSRHAADEPVKQAVSEHGLLAEDWGGESQFVNVSAKTGEGIDGLIEAISLQAEIL